jgi:hypothetical protein
MSDHPALFGEAHFANGGDTIRIEIVFVTVNYCTYSLNARTAMSNHRELDVDGDNANEDEDIYFLPDPPDIFHKGRVLLYVDVMDQTGDRMGYSIELHLFQGSTELPDSPFTITFPEMEKNLITEVFNIKLTGS